MNVVVTLEHRFSRTPDGKVWTHTTFPYAFWRRYLEVFDSVSVVARVMDVATVPKDWKQASGAEVSFVAIPHYIGPWQYLLKILKIRHSARSAVKPDDAVIFRVGSPIASLIQPMLQRLGHPYTVEVVADSYDVFAPGAVKHPLRAFFRWSGTRELRRQCSQADAAAYVTKFALQRRYPCPRFSMGISDVDIPERSLVKVSRLPMQEKRSFNLIFVGTMAQLYKAPDVLIEAIAGCVRSGLDVHITMLGDGKHRSELELQAKSLGIEKQVSFIGQISGGEAVIDQLDRADLFILPSYQEGLPRAMVEAMARSLPCIGSQVGGIPELLAPEDLVPPGNASALTDKIREVLTSPERMARMSARNLQKSSEYRDEILQQQRVEFYQYVRDITEVWQRRKK